MFKLASIVLGIVSSLILIACYPRFLVRWLAKIFPDVLFYVNTSPKVIALTIDDGPHSIVTPEILDVLATYKVPATFFLIGERLAQNEKVVCRIVEEGHEIGNHMMSDSPSISLSAEDFERQLLQVDKLLTRFGPVKWFRPGAALFNRRMIQQAKNHNYRTVLGSVYPYDAQISFVPFLVRYILLNAFPGSVIILHDGSLDRERTVKVLQRIIPALQQRGYRFVTLSELIEIYSHSR